MLDDLFWLIFTAWFYIWDIIGGPATVFIASLLWLWMVRIIIGFILSIFRLQDSYHVSSAKWKSNNSSKYTLFDVDSLSKTDE